MYTVQKTAHMSVCTDLQHSISCIIFHCMNMNMSVTPYCTNCSKGFTYANEQQPYQVDTFLVHFVDEERGPQRG